MPSTPYRPPGEVYRHQEAVAITFVFRLLAIFFDWTTKSVMRRPPSN
jgi:hypothetical protein